jgi:hypothetical protein
MSLISPLKDITDPLTLKNVFNKDPKDKTSLEPEIKEVLSQFLLK